MRECRGRHIFCWRLLTCMETPIKYCTSCWYCCTGEVSSLDSYGHSFACKYQWIMNTMRAQRAPFGQSNWTLPLLGNHKYINQDHPEDTNSKHIMRERCASHARRGGWERADFSKIQGLLTWSPRCLQIAHCMQITYMRTHAKKHHPSSIWEPQRRSSIRIST